MFKYLRNFFHNCREARKFNSSIANSGTSMDIYHRHSRTGEEEIICGIWSTDIWSVSVGIAGITMIQHMLTYQSVATLKDGDSFKAISYNGAISFILTYKDGRLEFKADHRDTFWDF